MKNKPSSILNSMALEQISKQNKRISGLLLRGKVRYWNHTGGKNAACL